MPELTIHERVAYVLAMSFVGTQMTYDEILATIKRNAPSEEEARLKAAKAFEHLLAVSAEIGKPITESFDEWLDRGRERYLKRRGQG